MKRFIYALSITTILSGGELVNAHAKKPLMEEGGYSKGIKRVFLKLNEINQSHHIAFFKGIPAKRGPIFSQKIIGDERNNRRFLINTGLINRKKTNLPRKARVMLRADLKRDIGKVRKIEIKKYAAAPVSSKKKIKEEKRAYLKGIKFKGIPTLKNEYNVVHKKREFILTGTNFRFLRGISKKWQTNTYPNLPKTQVVALLLPKTEASTAEIIREQQTPGFVAIPVSSTVDAVITPRKTRRFSISEPNTSKSTDDIEFSRETKRNLSEFFDRLALNYHGTFSENKLEYSLESSYPGSFEKSGKEVGQRQSPQQIIENQEPQEGKVLNAQALSIQDQNHNLSLSSQKNIILDAAFPKDVNDEVTPDELKGTHALPLAVIDGQDIYKEDNQSQSQGQENAIGVESLNADQNSPIGNDGTSFDALETALYNLKCRITALRFSYWAENNLEKREEQLNGAEDFLQAIEQQVVSLLGIEPQYTGLEKELELAKERLIEVRRDFEKEAFKAAERLQFIAEERDSNIVLRATQAESLEAVISHLEKKISEFKKPLEDLYACYAPKHSAEEVNSSISELKDMIAILSTLESSLDRLTSSIEQDNGMDVEDSIAYRARIESFKERLQEIKIDVGLLNSQVEAFASPYTGISSSKIETQPAINEESILNATQSIIKEVAFQKDESSNNVQQNLPNPSAPPMTKEDQEEFNNTSEEDQAVLTRSNMIQQASEVGNKEIAELDYDLMETILPLHSLLSKNSCFESREDIGNDLVSLKDLFYAFWEAVFTLNQGFGIPGTASIFKLISKEDLLSFDLRQLESLTFNAMLLSFNPSKMKDESFVKQKDEVIKRAQTLMKVFEDILKKLTPTSGEKEIPMVNEKLGIDKSEVNQ